jgi:hypothetical protein
VLSQAVEVEVAALLSCQANKLADDSRQRLVRHGHLPERGSSRGRLITSVTKIRQ